MSKLIDNDSTDVMLCNIVYQRGNKDNNYDDYLNIMYRDLNTDEKKLKTIKHPKIDIYFTKEECMDYDYNKAFIEVDKCEKVECRYSKVQSELVKRANPDMQRYYKNCIETGNYRGKNNIYHSLNAFGSDMPIEPIYMMKWEDELHNDKPKELHKQFLDIEADTIDIVGFPKDGECPINAVTIVDAKYSKVHTFLLYNEKYKGIDDFIKNIDSFTDDLHESFDDIYGILDYKIYMYEKEDALIVDVFKLINTLKADFLLIWNGFGFDIPYIIARLKVLGYDPEDIMGHPDFPMNTCYFKKDTINFKVAEKRDVFMLSSHTKYIDQMVLYASLRKMGSELRSFSLNYIGNLEVGDEKIDYSDSSNIKTLVYDNYPLFVKYGIKDTLLQYGIEKKSQDVDNLYSRCSVNFTPYDNIFKQTVTLKNRAYKEYLLQGYILGNNVNIDYSTIGSFEKVKFKGALVGDPELNGHNGIKLFGKSSKYAYRNVVDFDFSSMYPFIMITFNIERNTMIGKLIITVDGYEKDPYEFPHIPKKTKKSQIDEDGEFISDTKYDSGQDFMDNYLTGDMISLGTKWLNLPTFDELNKNFIERHVPKKSSIFTKIKSVINRNGSV